MTRIIPKDLRGRARKNPTITIEILQPINDCFAITRCRLNDESDMPLNSLQLTHLPSTLAVGHAKKKAPLLRLAKQMAEFDWAFKVRRDFRDLREAARVRVAWEQRERFALKRGRGEEL